MNKDGPKLTRSGGGWFYSDFNLIKDGKKIEIKEVRTYSWLVGFILSRLFGVASYINSENSSGGYYVNTASLLEHLVNSAEARFPDLKTDHAKVLDEFLKDKKIRKIQLTSDEIYGVFDKCVDIGNKPVLEAKRKFLTAIGEIGQKLESDSLEENINGVKMYVASRNELETCKYTRQEAFGCNAILGEFTTLESKISAKMLSNLRAIIQSAGDSEGALEQAKSKLEQVKLLVGGVQIKINAETLENLNEQISSEEKVLALLEQQFTLKLNAVQERNTFLRHLENVQKSLKSEALQEKVEGLKTYVLLEKNRTTFSEDKEIQEKWLTLEALLPEVAGSIVGNYTEQLKQTGANTGQIQVFLNHLDAPIKLFENLGNKVLKQAFAENKKKLEELKSAAVQKLPAQRMAKLKADFAQLENELPKCGDEKALKELETRYQNLANQYQQLRPLAENEEDGVIDLQFNEKMKGFFEKEFSEVKKRIEQKRNEYLGHLKGIQEELTTPENVLSGLKNYGLYRYNYARLVNKEDRKNVDYKEVDEGFNNLEQGVLPKLLNQIGVGDDPKNQNEADARLNHLKEAKQAIEALGKSLEDIKALDRRDFTALTTAIKKNKERVEKLIKSIHEKGKQIGEKDVEGLLLEAIGKIPEKLESKDLTQVEQGLGEYAAYRLQYANLLSQSKKQNGLLDEPFKKLEDLDLPKALANLGSGVKSDGSDTTQLRACVEQLAKAKAIIDQFKAEFQKIQKADTKSDFSKLINAIAANEKRIEGALKGVQKELKELISKYNKNPNEDVKANLALLDTIVSERKQFFLREMGEIERNLESNSFEDNVKAVSAYIPLPNAVLDCKMAGEQNFGYKEITKAYKSLQSKLLGKMFANLDAVVKAAVDEKALKAAGEQLEKGHNTIRSLQEFKDIEDQLKEKEQLLGRLTDQLGVKKLAIETKNKLLSSLEAIGKNIESHEIGDMLDALNKYTFVKKEIAAILSGEKFAGIKADQGFEYEKIAVRLIQLEAALPKTIGAVVHFFSEEAKRLKPNANSKDIKDALQVIEGLERAIKGLGNLVKPGSEEQKNQNAQTLHAAIKDNGEKVKQLLLETTAKLPEERVKVVSSKNAEIFNELGFCKTEKKIVELEARYKLQASELADIMSVADNEEKQRFQCVHQFAQNLGEVMEERKKEILKIQTEFSSFVNGIEEKLKSLQTLEAGLREYAIYRLQHAQIVSAEKRQSVDYTQLDTRFENLERQVLPDLLNKIAADQNIPGEIKAARQRLQELAKEQKMIAELKAGIENIKKSDQKKSDFSLLEEAIKEAEGRIAQLIRSVKEKAKEFLPEDFDIAANAFDEVLLDVLGENKKKYQQTHVTATYNKLIAAANKCMELSEEERKKTTEAMKVYGTKYQEALQKAK